MTQRRAEEHHTHTPHARFRLWILDCGRVITMVNEDIEYIILIVSNLHMYKSLKKHSFPYRTQNNPFPAELQRDYQRKFTIPVF